MKEKKRLKELNDRMDSLLLKKYITPESTRFTRPKKFDWNRLFIDAVIFVCVSIIIFILFL